MWYLANRKNYQYLHISRAWICESLTKTIGLVVVVAIPRAFLIVSKNIQVVLDIDDLIFYNTHETLSFVVGGIVLTSFIDRWEAQLSGIRSGSQSCPLSFGVFLTSSTMMELK
jgi:hypothetical protein